MRGDCASHRMVSVTPVVTWPKASAAFAEALAALDRRESAKEAKENEHAATEPAKTKPAPIRAPAATVTDEPKTGEPVPHVLYGEVIPPNAGARREGNKTTSSRDEVSRFQATAARPATSSP